MSIRRFPNWQSGIRINMVYAAYIFAGGLFMRLSLKVHAAFFLIVVPLAYVMYVNIANLSACSDEGLRKEYTGALEDDLMEFLQKNFYGGGGELYTKISPEGADTDTLAESTGLLMRYSVLTGDRNLFDREFSFLRERLLVKGRFVRWKTGKREVACNSAVDDFRIIGALIDASGRWGDSGPKETAGLIQEGMLSCQTYDDNICEFYDWGQKTAKKSIPLCYIDLQTMRDLYKYDRQWREAARKGLKILKNGRIGNSPFFYKYYDYKTGQYRMDDEHAGGRGVCAIYSVISAMNLAKVQEDTRFFTRWLKNEMANRKKLFGWYDPETLEPSQDFESTAVYALAAIYSYSVGEKELGGQLLNKMLEFRVDNAHSQYHGGFGDGSRCEFYSFDNLTALLALEAAN